MRSAVLSVMVFPLCSRVSTPPAGRSERCQTGAVSRSVLEQARAGDERAFAELVGPHRRELRAHCYRMLGSFADAEDLLQETLTAAWRGRAGFEERASLRTWLYRIATNRCLNAIRDRRRAPAEPVPPFEPPEPTARDRKSVV